MYVIVLVLWLAVLNNEPLLFNRIQVSIFLKGESRHISLVLSILIIFNFFGSLLIMCFYFYVDLWSTLSCILRIKSAIQRQLVRNDSFKRLNINVLTHTLLTWGCMDYCYVRFWFLKHQLWGSHSLTLCGLSERLFSLKKHLGRHEDYGWSFPSVQKAISNTASQRVSTEHTTPGQFSLKTNFTFFIHSSINNVISAAVDLNEWWISLRLKH